MLTPQEIADKKFDKVMVWGYDMNAVDSFLEAVEGDYSQLYKENIALKSKMKVLIAKIDEYRKVDESMRKTLLGAQTMASEIVERARRESETRERQADEEVSRKLGELTGRVAAETARADMLRLQELQALFKCKPEALVERVKNRFEFFVDKVKNARTSSLNVPLVPFAKDPGFDDADWKLAATIDHLYEPVKAIRDNKEVEGAYPARIDLAQMETDEYANDMTVFDAAYAAAIAWWRRCHCPKKDRKWGVM